MTAPLAFIDTETTGLDPDRHEIWEVALVLPDRMNDYVWHLPVDLSRADAVALNIGRFHERHGRWPYDHVTHKVGDGGFHITDLESFARRFANLTWGCHLVGAVPNFDEERLRKLLRANGACPGWHYHLVDVETLAAGWLGIEPPWNSNDLSRAVGVNPDNFERHTALGDAYWAKAIYDAVIQSADRVTVGSPSAVKA